MIKFSLNLGVCFFLARPVDVELISVCQPLTVSVSQTSELHISMPGTI